MNRKTTGARFVKSLPVLGAIALAISASLAALVAVTQDTSERTTTHQGAGWQKL